jgi:GNAT superfamily N-acetyltransferase
MPVEITTLTKTDLESYIELVRVGFGAELAERGTNIAGVARLARVLLACRSLPLRTIELLTHRGLFVLLAKDGERAVGMLTVLKKRVPILIGAYVREEYRRSGVALALINEALSRLKRLGYLRVHGAVFDHTAQLLVERAGFAPYDHIDLYQRSLPLGTRHFSDGSVQRARRVDIPRHPYDLGPINLLIGVHIRRLVVRSGEREALAAMLIALPHQRVGEVQLRIIPPASEGALHALLGAADGWFTRLGRTRISVSLHDDTQALASILVEEGFVKRHSWVEMAVDL